MKKRRDNMQSGNLAKKRRGADPANTNMRRGWWSWLGREADAFFGLPEWLAWGILLLVCGVALAFWRWLTS